jgi:hypothetical protein
MRALLWTDHRPRIEYYVKAGLIPRAPTLEQLTQAFESIRSGVGALGQIRYYAKHPLMMFPTERKRAAARRSMAERARETHLAPHRVAVPAVRDEARAPLVDRALERLFLFSPARFVTQLAFNPWTAVPASGLNVPLPFLISHILQTNHPPPAIWDMQIVQTEDGGLDELDRRLERAMRRDGVRARVDRALGCREGYYEHLREWIPRLRRFEYPPVPAGLNPIAENLVEHLRYAAEL